MESVRRVARDYAVYNFSVADARNYSVGPLGWLVHNDNGIDPPPISHANGSVVVRESKWEYFFGRVDSTPQNRARSIDISRILRDAGFVDDAAGRTSLTRLFEIGRHLPEDGVRSTTYGVSILRSVPFGPQGHLKVGYFYRGGNMSLVPEITAIIPKV